MQGRNEPVRYAADRCRSARRHSSRPCSVLVFVWGEIVARRLTKWLPVQPDRFGIQNRCCRKGTARPALAASARLEPLAAAHEPDEPGAERREPDHHEPEASGFCENGMPATFMPSSPDTTVIGMATTVAAVSTQDGLVHLLGAGVEDLLVDQRGALGEHLQLVAEPRAAGRGFLAAAPGRAR